MGQNKEKRYYNEKKKSVDEVQNLQKSAKICKKICTKSMWLSGQLLIKNKQFLLFLNFVLQINRVIQVKSNIFF